MVLLSDRHPIDLTIGQELPPTFHYAWVILACLSAVRFMDRWSDEDVRRTIQQLDAGELMKLSDASLPIEVQRVANNIPRGKLALLGTVGRGPCHRWARIRLVSEEILYRLGHSGDEIVDRLSRWFLLVVVALISDVTKMLYKPPLLNIHNIRLLQ